MKTCDLIVKCLENEGVEYIFGIPGEETLDFMDSLSRSKISFVLTRHEQSAAFMADAYGRLSGKAGVCLSTLGPGRDEPAHGHSRRLPGPGPPRRHHGPGGTRAYP